MSRYWHLSYLAVIGWFLVMIIQSGRAVTDQEPSIGDRTEANRRFQWALIQKTEDYSHLTWLGKPIWQPPLDLWTLQEAIFEVKPDLLIECGTYQGGSSYFFAQLFDLMGKGRVITVDIEKLHTLSHPRVTYLIGDSVSPEIVERVRDEVEQVEGAVMVVLDSNHSQSHVRKEMEAYHGFVTPGSFLHVQDGIIDILPEFAVGRPGPLPAIEEFMREHDEFTVDQQRSERFLITHHPKGWLRRRNDVSN